MLEQIKRYLRITGSEEDILLTSLILAAKQYLANAGVNPPTPPEGLPFATVEFGEGDDGVITITAPIPGVEGDGYSVKILEAEEVGEGEDPPSLTVTLNDKQIVITLAEEGNTAEEIVSAINDLGGFTAEFADDGSGMFTEAMDEIYFSGGATAKETAYLQEQALYNMAAALYVHMLYEDTENKALDAAMTSIILQIKSYGGDTS